MAKAAKSAQQAALSEQVYEYVLNKILNHDLQPGEILNRRTIAEEMQVSIAPVLEALVRLEAEGLLTSLPRRGTQVRLIRPSEIADQMVMREAIECQAARYYCGEPILQNESRLMQLAENVEACRGGGVTAWKAEIEFHRALVEMAGCNSLLAAFKRAMHLGTLCAAQILAQTEDSLPIGNHVLLVQSLKTEDPDEAERFVRSHLHSGKRFFQRPQPVGKAIEQSEAVPASVAG